MAAAWRRRGRWGRSACVMLLTVTETLQPHRGAQTHIHLHFCPPSTFSGAVKGPIHKDGPAAQWRSEQQRRRRVSVVTASCCFIVVIYGSEGSWSVQMSRCSFLRRLKVHLDTLFALRRTSQHGNTASRRSSVSAVGSFLLRPSQDQDVLLRQENKE